MDGGAVTIAGTAIAALAIAGGEISDARAAKAEATAESASYNGSVLKHLIGSLQEFSEAVDLVASFVSLMEVELRQLARIGVNVQLRRSHYQKIKGKAQHLVQSCDLFLQIQPAITSDLLSVKQSLESGFAEDWEKRSTEFQSGSIVEVEDLDTAVARRR
jgi:hypothetical protein